MTKEDVVVAAIMPLLKRDIEANLKVDLSKKKIPRDKWDRFSKRWTLVDHLLKDFLLLKQYIDTAEYNKIYENFYLRIFKYIEKHFVEDKKASIVGYETALDKYLINLNSKTQDKTYRYTCLLPQNHKILNKYERLLVKNLVLEDLHEVIQDHPELVTIASATMFKSVLPESNPDNERLASLLLKLSLRDFINYFFQVRIDELIHYESNKADCENLASLRDTILSELPSGKNYIYLHTSYEADSSIMFSDLDIEVVLNPKNIKYFNFYHISKKDDLERIFKKQMTLMDFSWVNTLTSKDMKFTKNRNNIFKKLEATSMNEPSRLRNLTPSVVTKEKFKGDLLNKFSTIFEQSMSKDPLCVCLLYGKPGNGKTYLAEALSNGKKTLYFSNRTFSNLDSSEIGSQIYATLPDVVVIEDISDISNSLNTKLDLFDGTSGLDKLYKTLNKTLLVIMTCNEPNLIKPSFKRPGRIKFLIDYDKVMLEDESRFTVILNDYIKLKNVEFSEEEFEILIRIYKNTTIVYPKEIIDRVAVFGEFIFESWDSHWDDSSISPAIKEKWNNIQKAKKLASEE